LDSDDKEMTMTASTKRHLWIGLAAAVLAVAAWAGAAQAQQGPAPQERPRTDMRTLRQEMARDLFNITPDQEKMLRELREAGRKDRQAFRDEMLKMRDEMRALMKDPQANAAKIDKLIDARARLRAEREKKAFRSREDWRKVFTPEQLEKMSKYRGVIRERFAADETLGRGRSRGAWRWRHPYGGWDWY
jgi:Spy/CpxP family protein refolding chaperone